MRQDVSSGRRQPDPVCIVACEALASKVFWNQKTAGGDSDESPPFAVRPVSARGERTFCRVKVPKSPGSGKI